MPSVAVDNAREVLGYASTLGASVAGIADLKMVDPLPAYGGVVLRDFRHAVSMAIGLPSAAVEMISADHPGILYAWAYRTANTALDALALKVSALISGRGFRALAIPASMNLDPTQRVGHISHKSMAWAAGLGWIGRNGLLVNPTYGPRLRLVTVLTDMPLACGVPLKCRCGDCRLCVDSCPSKALRYADFETRPTSRESIFEASRCATRLAAMKALLEKQPASAPFAATVCGMCIRSCPVGKPVRG